jgi:hypothetical protein
MHADEMPLAVELLALERERQAAFLQALMRVAIGKPAPAVPDHDGAAAVLALRDGAFEFVVLDGVVLDVDGKPLLPRHQARAAGDRPALHHAVELQPEVVVQPAGGVLLNDKPIALGFASCLGGCLGRPAPGLRGDVELAFALVDLQAQIHDLSARTLKCEGTGEKRPARAQSSKRDRKGAVG